MSITIKSENGEVKTIGVNNSRTAYNLSEQETKAIEIIKSAFDEKGLPFNEISIERRSQSYLSLVLPNMNDFCRIHFGERSMWISLDMWRCGEELQNNRYFDTVSPKNRKKRHWEIPLKSVDEIKDVTDLIISVYNFIAPQEL